MRSDVEHTCQYEHFGSSAFNEDGVGIDDVFRCACGCEQIIVRSIIHFTSSKKLEREHADRLRKEGS